MTKKITVGHDSEKNEYVHVNITETKKTHHGGHKQSDQGYSDERMYGPGVEISKFYISKLKEKCEKLFTTPI